MIDFELQLPDLELLDFADLDLKLFSPESELVDDPNKDYTGMPDYDQQDKESFRHVIVHFQNEDDVESFFKAINQQDTGKTKSIWYPPQENMDTESKRYG